MKQLDVRTEQNRNMEILINKLFKYHFIMSWCLTPEIHPKYLYCPSKQFKKLKAPFSQFRNKKKKCKSIFWNILRNKAQYSEKL
ncbi:unnamed protein product [Blepharisma stoltei]|uniref:Uncharacterized protein n=1 Tax=Blepharisma stoltei TaxID=1481888 RepID=A0AAU9KED9_9CILI|nr:unnamed protein product [Blepharisma stoltei]